MACFRRARISDEGRRVDAEVAGMPDGRCSKALCSSETLAVDGDRLDFEGSRFIGEPSGRFLGRPRSMMEDAPSDSWRRWP